MFRKSFSTLQFYSRRLLSAQSLDGFDWTKQRKILMEPFEYIQKVPCKHHKMVAPAFNHWLQIPEKKIDDIQVPIQTLVTWTLLLDDIQDESAYRYGVPSAHKVFGVASTINAASLALLLGQKQIADLEHPLATNVFVKRIEEYLDGQGSDIHWRDNFSCPTAETHMNMARKKDGSFLAFPVELMQLFSSNKADYTELAADIGVYFHLLDDYYNLFLPKKTEWFASVKQNNYTTCSDITECKITLPIIHAMQFPDVASELTDILKQRTSDPNLQNRVISLLKRHGSDEYVRNTLQKVEADIRIKIEQLGGNETLTAFMDDVSLHKQECGQSAQEFKTIHS